MALTPAQSQNNVTLSCVNKTDRARVGRDEQWVEQPKGPPKLRPIGGSTGLRSLPKSGQFPPLLPCSTHVFPAGCRNVERLGIEHGQRACCFPAVRLWPAADVHIAQPLFRYPMCWVNGSMGLGVDLKRGSEMGGKGDVSTARLAWSRDSPNFLIFRARMITRKKVL